MEKVSSVCGVGQGTKNLCQKFNSQCPVLRILGLRVASPKSQGPSSVVLGVRVSVPGSQVPGPWSQDSRVTGLRVPGSRISGSQHPGSQGPSIPGLRVPRPRALGPGSQVLILDYALHV